MDDKNGKEKEGERPPDLPIVKQESAGETRSQTCDAQQKKSIRWWKRPIWWQVFFNGTIATFTVLYACVSYKQLEILRQTLTADQRPWVFAGDISIGTLEPNQPNPVQIVFINTGRTPARIFEECTEFLITNRPLPETPPYTPFTQNVILTPGLIRVAANQTQPMPPQTIAAIKDRSAQFYIFGYVKYRDTFGIEHKTGFNVIFNPEKSRFDSHPHKNYT